MNAFGYLAHLRPRSDFRDAAHLRQRIDLAQMLQRFRSYHECAHYQPARGVWRKYSKRESRWTRYLFARREGSAHDARHIVQ